MPSSSSDAENPQSVSRHTTDNFSTRSHRRFSSNGDRSVMSPMEEINLPLLETRTGLHQPRSPSSSPQWWYERMAQKHSFISWLHPNPPYKRLNIKPAFPRLEHRLRKVLPTWMPAQSPTAACSIVLLLWTIIFTTLLVASSRVRPSLSGNELPLQLACNTGLWPNATFCGLDGRNCAPFTDKSFTFRCPSDCLSMHVLEPHTIGDQEIVYQTAVVGGGNAASGELPIYRGDSFICQAAIHAGVLGNNGGGCGTLTRIGERRDFIASSSNGISSIPFLPDFPLAFTISSAGDGCADPQWSLLAVSIAASAVISLLATSSEVFTVSIFTIVFYQIALASDRPFYADISSAISMSFERFLPTTFMVYVLHQFCIGHTLNGLQAHVEKAVLWTGGCWIGALNNYTFDRLPISRLTAHDLYQQPGALVALFAIIGVIAAASVGQVSAFVVEGRLAKYLTFYCFAISGLVILGLIPNLQLRLHHYILALLLLPGTAVQTRPSLLYQGILFGLLLNGIARWGYASILQTAEALREDAQLGSALPKIKHPDLSDHSSLQFVINQLAPGFDGISVLINDVERYQESQVTLPFTFRWSRPATDLPTFFRFAFTSYLALGGITYGDFTKTGTLHANGTWESMGIGTT